MHNKVHSLKKIVHLRNNFTLKESVLLSIQPIKSCSYLRILDLESVLVGRRHSSERMPVGEIDNCTYDSVMFIYELANLF